MALGAVERDVLRMVLKSALALVTAGALAGVIMSLALTRLMARQIGGVSATDPWTFSVVVLVLFVAGLAACLLPARQAMRAWEEAGFPLRREPMLRARIRRLLAPRAAG